MSFLCVAGAPGVGCRELKSHLVASDPDLFKEPVTCKLYFCTKIEL